MDPKVKFYELANSAEKRYAESLDIGEVEPIFLEVLDLILRHPEEKSTFIDCFENVISNGYTTPPELVSFCMHELRWPELKKSLNDWLLIEKSERIRHVLRQTLEAFNDDWNDADMYFKFGK